MTPTNSLSRGEANASLFQRFLHWIAEGEVRRTHTRACLRVKTDFDGKISSQIGTMEFSGIDLHDAGIGAKVWRRLEPGTTVFIHLRTYSQTGFAVVRHCTRRGLIGYHVGLEFRSPLMSTDAGSWHLQQVKDPGTSAEEWDALMGRR